MCVASLVYHAEFLKEKLESRHPLLATPLFGEKMMLQNLKTMLKSGRKNFDDPKDVMNPSGIPPHVENKVLLARIANGVAEIRPIINEATEAMATRINENLEERAINAGTVTFEGLDRRLDDALRRSGLLDMVDLMQSNEGRTAHQETNPVQNQPTLYVWGGHYRRLPQNFQFPKVRVSQLWVLWCIGSTEQNIPAYRRLSPQDFNLLSSRKRFSDVKFLMMKFAKKAKESGMNEYPKTSEEALEWFSKCENAIELSQETAKKRSRRIGQLVWSTVVWELRSKKKQRTN